MEHIIGENIFICWYIEKNSACDGNLIIYRERTQPVKFFPWINTFPQDQFESHHFKIAHWAQLVSPKAGFALIQSYDAQSFGQNINLFNITVWNQNSKKSILVSRQ